MGVLYLAALFLFTPAASGAPVTPPVHFTADAINVAPSVNLSAALVDIGIDRWSTDAERQRLVDAAVRGGQASLLDTLQDLPRVGSFRTPDSVSYDIQYAREHALPDGGDQIVIVTDRNISFWEAAHDTRSLDYPFTVIELRIGASGKGEGRMSVATKIYVDPDTHQVTLENYSEQPVRLTNVEVSKLLASAGITPSSPAGSSARPR